MRFLRMLTNALLAGAFGAAYLTIIVLQLNPEVPLLDNPRHRNAIEDARNTARKLAAEPVPDIVLVGHPQAMFAQTAERMRKGERPHPLLNGADAWTRQLATATAGFERRVAQERR